MPRSPTPPLARAVLTAGLALTLTALAPAVGLAGQEPDTITYTYPPGSVVEMMGPDSMMAAELEANGTSYETRRAVLWVPADSMDPPHARALADTLDRVVAAVEALVGGPHEWQRWRHPRVRYYAYAEPFISHAEFGARVFVSLGRARSGTAPWVHETAHALLMVKRDTLWERATTRVELMALVERELGWLGEGLPSALAELVWERTGVRDFDPLHDAPIESGHAQCRAHLDTPAGQRILPLMGGAGRPAGLMGPQRMEVAPAYYACGTSLARWLVDRHGVAPVGALLNAADGAAALAELTGMPAAELREAWLASIRP